MGGDHSKEVYIETPGYLIISGPCVRVLDLQKKVAGLLAEGYALVGGAIPDGQGRLYQTLYRPIGGNERGNIWHV